MYGLFFCITSFVLGTSIALYFPKFKRIEEKLTLGLILGLTLTTWATFLLSFIFRVLNIKLILAISFASLIISLLLFRYYRRVKYPLVIKPQGIYLFSSIIFTILLSIAHLNTIKFDAQGNLRTMQHAWGDYAFHLASIFHFVEKNHIVLNHPLIVNHKLSYHFLVNFLSAIMYKGGLDYVSSIVLTNILLSLSLISIAYLFAENFILSPIGSVFVLILFFLNGNLGFIFALGKEFKEILLPLSFYTNNNTKGLIWGNTLAVSLLPQRGFIWGIAIAILIYLIFLKGFISREENLTRRDLFLAGVLLGLIPFIHTASFPTIIFVAIFLFFSQR
ncbi:MAG: hypothetical protein ACK4NT_07305, partial [Candidatus Omnitrophota bacterium]